MKTFITSLLAVMLFMSCTIGGSSGHIKPKSSVDSIMAAALPPVDTEFGAAKTPSPAVEQMINQMALLYSAHFVQYYLATDSGHISPFTTVVLNNGAEYTLASDSTQTISTSDNKLMQNTALHLTKQNVPYYVRRDDVDGTWNIVYRAQLYIPDLINP